MIKTRVLLWLIVVGLGVFTLCVSGATGPNGEPAKGRRALASFFSTSATAAPAPPSGTGGAATGGEATPTIIATLMIHSGTPDPYILITDEATIATLKQKVANLTPVNVPNWVLAGRWPKLGYNGVELENQDMSVPGFPRVVGAYWDIVVQLPDDPEADLSTSQVFQDANDLEGFVIDLFEANEPGWRHIATSLGYGAPP